MSTDPAWVAVDERGEPQPRHCVHLDDLPQVASPSQEITMSPAADG